MSLQETQLSLTNRATRLEILTFEKILWPWNRVRVRQFYWKCHRL